MSHRGKRRGSHKMLIYIAGVCHDDPKGKANLTAWLHKLSAAHRGPPAFVGVEYDKDKFADLKQQRPLLRQKMESYGPAASPDVLDALADCLAYEPDAVADVFPNLEPLWLDTGTSLATTSLYNRLGSIYQDRLELKKVVFPAETTTVLALMSEAAWETFERQGAQASCPRDEKFARLVLEKIEQVSGGWAIVIVGANHATPTPGSMRSRLTAPGIDCEVDLIKPNGPVPA